MNQDDLDLMNRIAELEAAEAELKALKKRAAKVVRMKVSQKGAVSIYGMRRLPITLYRNEINQIRDLFDSGRIDNFIEENNTVLADR